jgi:hypothetical protein
LPLRLPRPQDKINAFWEITKKDLEDRKAELRNKDREMEEMEERHQVEVKVRRHTPGLRVTQCHMGDAPVVLQPRNNDSMLHPLPSPDSLLSVPSPIHVHAATHTISRPVQRLSWPPLPPTPHPQVYKQKVKHLLYEHQAHITALKADAELGLALQQDDFRKRESGLGQDKRSLKQELKEQVGGKGWVLAGEQAAAVSSFTQQVAMK